MLLLNYFLTFLLVYGLHPIHLGVCEMNYNIKTKSLEISHKVFYDDLESAIAKQYKQQLHLNTPQEMANANEWIQKYIEKNFVVRIGSNSLKANYIGKEYEAEALWIYYEIESCPSSAQLLITNQLLTDLYDDQVHFLHFTKQDFKQSVRFSFDDRLKAINF